MKAQKKVIRNTVAAVDETAAVAPAIEEALPAVEETFEEATVPVEPTVAPDLAQKKTDFVIFVPNRLIRPAPFIGGYDCLMNLGLTQFEKDKSYKLPKYVAEVLNDHKLGIIVNG